MDPMDVEPINSQPGNLFAYREFLSRRTLREISAEKKELIYVRLDETGRSNKLLLNAITVYERVDRSLCLA